MTRYEEMIEKGEIDPLTGLDILMIRITIQDFIEGNQNMDADSYEMIKELMIEIEHILKNEPDTLENLLGLMKPFNESLVNA